MIVCAGHECAPWSAGHEVLPGLLGMRCSLVSNLGAVKESGCGSKGVVRGCADGDHHTGASCLECMLVAAVEGISHKLL
jgi:hypothetical protein